MYTLWACTFLLFPHLLPSASIAASAAILPNTEASNSVSTSGHGIIQPQNSTPKAPITILTLPIPTPNTTATSSIIVPIAGKDIFLRITYIGESSLATSLLETLVGGAYAHISEAMASHPDDPVTPLPWLYKSHSAQWRHTIALWIGGHEDKVFTWLQLYWVLGGLLHFMEGEPSQLHPINFDVNVGEEGMVAVGMLWCSQSPASREADKGRMGSRGDGSK